MTTFFSEEQIEQLRSEASDVPCKFKQLQNSYIYMTLGNNRAQEFARHGFCRRLKNLNRCIERVFEILPPDLDGLPEKSQITDAEIHIQSFIFNVFGSADNLAWIFAEEKAIKNKGTPLKATWVGLGPKNTIVRNSLSNEFQSFLANLDKNHWFEHLESFRHALAHRIPLYIPPYAVKEENAQRDADYDIEILDAIKSQNFDRMSKLEEEQLELRYFQPVMKHSWSERSEAVVFHVQMLADFQTVYNLGSRMLGELDR